MRDPQNHLLDVLPPKTQLRYAEISCAACSHCPRKMASTVRRTTLPQLLVVARS